MPQEERDTVIVVINNHNDKRIMRFLFILRIKRYKDKNCFGSLPIFGGMLFLLGRIMRGYIFHFGKYWIFMKSLFLKPEKFSIYRRQVLKEMVSIGYDSLGIAMLMSVFMGAVLTIQSVHNIVNPLVPMWAVAVVTRDAVILEFSPTIICLILAGKVGSSIASELGTMRVTEQIDALEIMGINSAGYLVLPKIIAALIIIPFVITLTMVAGIFGGYLAAVATDIMTPQTFMRGILDDFLVFNYVFAMIKTVSFAFVIASIASYQGFFTKGGALEVGQSSTRAVVWGNIMIIILDYVLTQLLLS